MEQVWTILKIINWGANFLNEKGIEDARLNIELMLCHVLNMNRIQLYSNFEKPLTKDELTVLKTMLKRRIAFEPLQYIIGEAYFYGLRFLCNKNVFIPRPETELLIEQFTREVKQGEFTLLDIGTGSGCIAITLAKFYPDAKITAIDISANAIEIAKKNAEYHGVNIEFLEADILSFNTNNIFDYMVSNPPYIPQSGLHDLQKEILLHEPEIAYTDKFDGLTHYRRFQSIIHNNLKQGGKFYFEIGSNQSDDVSMLFREYKLKISKDFQNFPRIICVTN